MPTKTKLVTKKQVVARMKKLHIMGFDQVGSPPFTLTEMMEHLDQIEAMYKDRRREAARHRGRRKKS